MHRRVLKQLVVESYTDVELDQRKILRIASILKRKDLKEYIKALKNEEQKTTVIVTLADNQDFFEDDFKNIFPNKKILFEKDPTLLLGARVTDNDMLYEFNLRNTLDKMIKYINETYD